MIAYNVFIILGNMSILPDDIGFGHIDRINTRVQAIANAFEKVMGEKRFIKPYFLACV